MAFYTETVAINQFYDRLIANMKTNGWAETITPTKCHPNLTANSNPTVTPITLSGTVPLAGYEIFRAFDGDLSTAWAVPMTTSTTPTIKIDFGSSPEYRKVINKYTIAARAESGNLTQAPKDFILEASNSGGNLAEEWTLLDTQTNQINWGPSEKRSFVFTNTTPYQFYRLTVKFNNGSTAYTAFAEMEFYETVAQSKLSGNYDSLMTSSGTSGTDTLRLLISKGNSKTLSGNYISIGILEYMKYPETVPINLYSQTYHFSYTTTSVTNLTQTQLTYYMDVNADRVYFATVLDPSANGGTNNVCYAGLIKRYSAESDSTAICVAAGIGAPTRETARMLKNRANQFLIDYPLRYLSHSFAPSVWGDAIFASPVIIEGANEGVRGELEGVFVARNENLVNEDEILIGTSKYKVILPPVVSGVNNSYPANYAVLFKLPSA